jgi:tetrapyrrole methylase family protein/MazG family protein
MKIHDLIELVKLLRSKCPWDRDQTLESIKNNVIEESYELVEAIEQGDTAAIKEEIGDFLFLSFFLATIFQEEKNIDLDELISSTITKYREKHPHVFKGDELKNQDEVLKFWQQSKKDIFSGISKVLPALLAAKIIQERASKVGFDWASHEGPLEKVTEEVGELSASIGSENTLEEFGDLLFACVNLARHLNIDPEDALRYANTKFVNRFRKIKTEVETRGKTLEDVSLQEMDRIWDEIKHQDER